jgi:hypothetical protein
MEDEILQIEVGNKVVNLHLLPFDGDIDIDEILKIDYSNVLGEILTFNVLYNRIANFRAEVENDLKHLKLDLEVFEAQLKEEYRVKLAGKGGKVTVDEVGSNVIQDERLIAKRRYQLKREKEFSYLDNLYWNAQGKLQLLQRLSDKLVPDDLHRDLLEDTVNGIMIKMTRKVIK